MNILVTGGAGYIGSHAALKLLELGHAVTIIDDLSRGHLGAIESLTRVGGDLHFVNGCFGDRSVLDKLLRERGIEAVMHFAALTYVGESVEQPLRYYRNNTANALTLIEAMDDAGVNTMVFSSTAATYGEPPPEQIPIKETCPQTPVNPYGASKLMVERMLQDYARSTFRFAALRYFNVAGNDEACRLGEHHDPETHLIPICLDAALGKRTEVVIFGDDYPTPDGTCIRDYVHVSDLIDAHIAAMNHLLDAGPVEQGEEDPDRTAISDRTHDNLQCNIGIGRGYSVREVIDACKRITGIDFPTRIGARRAGDPPILYADPSKAQDVLKFMPRYTSLDAIIETAWKWRKANPDGYASDTAH